IYQKNFGGIIGVEDAWLILRGMKTMGLRMEKSITNAMKISRFLVENPKILKVYYPGLDSHSNYEIHKSQALSGGAILSFEMEPTYSVNTIIYKLKYPVFAVRLGGVESILSHPATMSHGCMSKEERLSQGVTDNLFRLSCGIEDIEDLLMDLSLAFK